MAGTEEAVRPLRRSPVTEAVIDVRVIRDNPIAPESFLGSYDAIKSDYPGRHERLAVEGGFTIQNRKGECFTAVQSSSKVDGFVFKSADGKQIVQMRLDGFSFHRLKPYQHWVPFRDEARRLWRLYQPYMTGAKVVRLALRYINRIEIPLPFKDFREYILTTPEIAPGVPQNLVEFIMRIVIPRPDGNAFAIVTETHQPIQGTKLPLIFDVETFQAGIWEPAEESIWDSLESLREFKNDIFFKSITDKTKEMLDRE
jgi:uncharacterized protein (TIGR04255 family)